MKKNLWIVGGGAAIGKALAERLCVDYQIISIHRKVGQRVTNDGVIHEAIDLADLTELERSIGLINAQYPPTAIVFAQRYRPLVEMADHLSLALATEIQSSATIVDVVNQSHSASLVSVLFLTSINYKLINKKLPLWYHITKSAQVTLTKYLAVSNEGTNFNVNAIELGSFLKYPLYEYSKKEQNWFDLLKANTPMSELLEINRLISFIEFMISDVAKMSNGQIITLDGGISSVAQETLIR